MQDAANCTICEAETDGLELCRKCEVPSLIGVRMIQSPGVSNAIRFAVKVNRVMATQANSELLKELYSVFGRLGSKMAIVTPLLIDPDMLQLLGSFSEQRRELFFRSHCFRLKGENPLSRPIVSTQGHVVKVIMGNDGVQSLQYLDTVVPVISHVQTVNGNHIFRTKGMLYPHATSVVASTNHLWSPWNFMLHFSECSNMVSTLIETGVAKDYVQNITEPYTLFLPRDDTYTEQQMKWLLQTQPQDIVLEFVKRHIVKGYLNVEQNIYFQRFDGPKYESFTNVQTEGRDSLGVTKKYIHERIFPAIRYYNEYDIGSAEYEAHCMEHYNLMRGIVIIIDRPIYDFPSDLSARSDM